MSAHTKTPKRKKERKVSKKCLSFSHTLFYSLALTFIHKADVAESLTKRSYTYGYTKTANR